MSEMSGAAALMAALEKEKVEYIFGLPGGAKSANIRCFGRF